jgi:hypothetical protein
MLRAAPGQPKGEKKHHDTIRDMIAASLHVLSSISRGGTQWICGGRLFVVSARTNKRRHHQTCCVSVVYCKRKWNILWNVRVFRGINKALKQQPRPIRLSQ